jgi:hypothetical protein
MKYLLLIATTLKIFVIESNAGEIFVKVTYLNRSLRFSLK